MGKLKKRGFVMTGGGAKGLYEAGVIHAFHITGMEFDVITGSSIGAMNSAFFCEYLYHKRQLPEAVRQDALQALEALDVRVRAFHHAWLQMPDRKLVDDSDSGPIGKLKEDLTGLNLSLPFLVRLGWWWTDPDHSAFPSPLLWPAFLRFLLELSNRLGGFAVLLNIVKNQRQTLVQSLRRQYLSRFGIEQALIPSDQDHRLKDVFTLPVSPLTEIHLSGSVSAPDAEGSETYVLVDPQRTMRDYAENGIVMRVTRANYRTGRLEISAYVPMTHFARFLQKQAWRLEINDLDKVPLGSARLQVPGNPNVVNAALCSGRFPGVFSPFQLKDIYPPKDAENGPLYQMASNGLADPGLQEGLIAARSIASLGVAAQDWQASVERWGQSNLGSLFPRTGDIYVDGGSIDNTPTNSAVDYVREWIDQNDLSRRAVELELFVIYLDKEPEIVEEEIGQPDAVKVVQRTLAIQGAGKASSDANTVDTINTFGKRGEGLGLALSALLAGLRAQPDLGPGQKQALEESLYQKAQQLGLSGFLGDGPAGILERLESWAQKTVSTGLPLHVEMVKIYPDEMPMDTLQFTERLGYKKENAIQMLTHGCFDTLWSLRDRLESETDRDERDRQVLALARKWMGGVEWPAAPDQRIKMRSAWACQRTACVYHARYCPHGAAMIQKTTA
jgi:hypothetical protein